MEKDGYSGWETKCEDFTKQKLHKWIFKVKAQAYWTKNGKIFPVNSM